MSFAAFNLNSEITKAIQFCGYTTPTPVQSSCIPPILEGKDIIASAQTGTGKTAAFVLPALQRLSQKKTTKPRILILTPTRELAAQITKAATQYGKFLKFNIVSLVGGMPYRQQLRDLSRRVDIIVATPGRLLDHLENRRIDLSSIEMLILDEADRMLDMGFIDDVEYIAKLLPQQRQTLLFSATVNDELATIIQHLLKSPIRIDLSSKKITAAAIKQELYMADNFEHKSKLLRHFLMNASIYKAIIFSATKMNADKLAEQLRAEGFLAAALHGDLKQSVRNRTLEQLRRSKIQYLVATDVAARGINITDISHVFNFDLPKFSEDYVHRIGRTGRAGKTGVAISLATLDDIRAIKRIERYTGQILEELKVPGLEPTKRSQSKFANSDKKKKFFKKKPKSYNSAYSTPSRAKTSKMQNGESHKQETHKQEGQARKPYGQKHTKKEDNGRKRFFSGKNTKSNQDRAYSY